LAAYGPGIRTGADLAAKHLNEAAEEVLGGKLIELVHEDSETAEGPAIDRARKLIEVDGVPAIVGALSSGVTIPVAESVTIPAKVVQISPASTSPLITVLPADEGQDFLYRTCPSDALQGVVAAQLARGQIVPEWSFNTAATTFINNPYGQGLNDVFAQEFQNLGGSVLAQVPHPHDPQPTYVAELEEALANEPEVLLVISYVPQTIVILKESRDIFNYTSWQFVDGNKALDIIRDVGAETLADKLGTAPGPDPARGGYQNFLEAYEAEYGELPPLPFIDTCYDAVAVIGLAIVKCIVDGVEINGVNVRDRLRIVSNPYGETVITGPEAFKRAFELLQSCGVGGLDALDYSGAAGEVDFDEHGDVITPIEIFKYTAEGTIETVTFVK
jgi:ABC-type branched-subunit amino acid transport system substrate-binding protein